MPESSEGVEMGEEATETFEAIIEFLENQFGINGIEYKEDIGGYTFRCVADNIEFHTNNPIALSPEYEAMATAQCYYTDKNKQKQNITIPLIVHNTESDTTLIGENNFVQGHYDNDGAYAIKLEREGFDQDHLVIRVLFNDIPEVGNKTPRWNHSGNNAGWYDKLFLREYIKL